MRDRKHLVILAQRLHLSADGVGDFAADIGINFVKNQQSDKVLLSQRGLNGQHDARDFPAGSDRPKGFQRFTWLRRKKKLNLIESAADCLSQSFPLQIESRLLKAEIGQVNSNLLG